MPAAVTEQVRDFAGDRARVVRDGNPAIPERLEAVECVRVVAPRVVLPRFGRVRQHAVKLDHDAVLRVPHVGVLSGAAPGRHRLPVAARQAVPALDVPEISQLKWRVDAYRDLGDGVREVAAPARPVPAGQRGGDPVRRAQPALARLDRPGNRILGGRRHIRQVQDRFLKRGLRRQPRRMPRARQPRRVMQHQTWDIQRAGLPRDAHVDRGRGLISEVPYLCGGVMTENRVVTGPQHCAPKSGSAWHGTAERREYSRVEPLPSP